MKSYPKVDCTNDVQMVSLALRQPKLDIDRSVFGQDKNIIKSIKEDNSLRDEIISIIVKSNPRFNLILKIK